jgi:ComF family protein
MFRRTALFIQSLLDIVLPRKERLVRIDEYRAENIPVAPTEHDMRGAHIITLMKYRNTVVEDLIRALKYDRNAPAAGLLANVLAEYLREEIANIRSFSIQEVLLVPVPLHETRLRERGFNQIEKVLNALPHEYHDGTYARVIPHALVRTRATEQQTRLSRADRLENVRSAFAIVDAHAVCDAHIILIDDVTTTGATLSEAARPFGTTPTLVALAHA